MRSSPTRIENRPRQRSFRTLRLRITVQTTERYEQLPQFAQARSSKLSGGLNDDKADPSAKCRGGDSCVAWRPPALFRSCRQLSQRLSRWQRAGKAYVRPEEHRLTSPDV
jgi:hypothetical protein